MSGLRCVFHAIILAGPPGVAACAWQMIATGQIGWQVATIAAGAAVVAADVAERVTRR